MELELKGGGWLRVREEGALVVLEAWRKADGRGLYKVWLCGHRDRMLLGTLVPEGDRLWLRRRVFRQELERGGCWPLEGGECVMTFPFSGRGSGWQREERPGRLVAGELSACFDGRWALYRKEERGFVLAFPFDPSHPFPVPPLFCLARLERVDGQGHVLFYFDAGGNPLLPHNGNDCGENSGAS